MARSRSVASSSARVLAILLLHANAVVSSDRLVDELWGDTPPQTAAKSLQVHVSRLRKELGKDRLGTRPPGYVLNLEAAELDLTRFEQLFGEARTADPETAAQKLRQALALWRGPALADLAYQPFAQAEIARLEELRLAAVEHRVDADLATGRHSEIVGELEALVAEHPLRERLRGQLMIALYRSGRQAEALDAYRDGRERLLEELGLEPSEDLKGLEQAILRHDSSLELAPEAPGPAAPSRGASAERSILIVPRALEGLAPLLGLARAARRRPAAARADRGGRRRER